MNGNFSVVCCILTFLLVGSANLLAQDKYWISFTDKAGVKYDPFAELHPDAIARRQLEGLDLMDSTDFPVNQDYVESVSHLVESVSTVSRWLNGLVCFAKPSDILQLEKLPFIKEIHPMRPQRLEVSAILSEEKYTVPSTFSHRNEKILEAQTEIMGRDLFDQMGLRGQGVRIAVLDAGFRGANEHQSLKHLFENGQIEMAYDFVGRDENPYHGSTHGTAVLSCIGGMHGNIPMGLATESRFLLARTERNLWEFASEEEYWLEAVEWADRNGAHVINSSLGYTEDRYTWEDMDGQSALVSRAANMAARKGILVVCSAGNDGDEPWQILGAPADSDSVLAVGGIAPWSGLATSFSSYGPNANGSPKPNLSAFGYAICASGKENELDLLPGTSFSSPLVAGFVACTKQAFPELTWKELFDKVESAGHLYPYHDEVHGKGIPSAPALFGEKCLTGDSFFAIHLATDGDRGEINVLLNEAFEEQDYPMSRTIPYVYWKICDKDGRVKRFALVLPEGKVGARIPSQFLAENDRLIVHYNGFTQEYIENDTN